MGALRLNCGCGMFKIRGYVNIDSDPEVQPDLVATLPPLPYSDEEVDEVYAGHFLEHLGYEDGKTFLKECYRVLKPGGKLGVVVPDTREIVAHWLGGLSDIVEVPRGYFWPLADLDAVCHVFLYSDIQGSGHKWAYDKFTLQRAMQRAGFEEFREINRHFDPRLGGPAWYQCGWDSYKPRKRWEKGKEQ